MNWTHFADRHYAALAADEIRHNILLAILRRKQTDPDLDVRAWDLGGPGRCAVQQDGHGIVLGDIEESDAEQLARMIVGDVPPSVALPSIMGPDDNGRWLVEALAKHDYAFASVTPQTIHVLDHHPVHPDCDGKFRLAEPADAELVFDWFERFQAEAAPEGEPPAREDVEQRIETQRVFLWSLKSRPVAMCCAGRMLDQGVGIAPVYTPPEHRCRGFAGAVTARVVEHVLTRGYRYAYLFTDDTNPASCRCYAKIGFRPHCKADMYRRSD
ncbi:MAG: GNAT family N-acetyltransferase [Pseudomonadota bacterium]